jgi:hypothetical protein
MIASETKTATVTTGAVVAITDFGFTAGKLAEANAARISCSANNMHVTWSGTEPTASLGHPVIETASLTTNEPFCVDGKENVANIKLIGLSGNAVATITIGR